MNSVSSAARSALKSKQAADKRVKTVVVVEPESVALPSDSDEEGYQTANSELEKTLDRSKEAEQPPDLSDLSILTDLDHILPKSLTDPETSSKDKHLSDPNTNQTSEPNTINQLPMATTNKNLMHPNSRDAPRFDWKRPQEFPRFKEHMAFAFKNAGWTDEVEKKKAIVLYTDADTEDQWKALPGFGDAAVTYSAFLLEIEALYPEIAEWRQGSVAKLDAVVERYANPGIKKSDPSSYYRYKREFNVEAGRLTTGTATTVTNRELVEKFVSGLGAGFREALLTKLSVLAEVKKSIASQANQPAPAPRRPEDRYDLKDVIEAGEALVNEHLGTRGIAEPLAVVPSIQSGRLDSGYVKPMNIKVEETMNEMASALAKIQDSLELNSRTLKSYKVDADKHREDVERQMRQFQQGAREDNRSNTPRPQGHSYGDGHGHSHGSDPNCSYCYEQGHSVEHCQHRRKHLQEGKIVVTSNGHKLGDGNKFPWDDKPGRSPRKKCDDYYAEKAGSKSSLYQGEFVIDDTPTMPMVAPGMYRYAPTPPNPVPGGRREQIAQLLNELFNEPSGATGQTTQGPNAGNGYGNSSSAPAQQQGFGRVQ